MTKCHIDAIYVTIDLKKKSEGPFTGTQVRHRLQVRIGSYMPRNCKTIAVRSHATIWPDNGLHGAMCMNSQLGSSIGHETKMSHRDLLIAFVDELHYVRNFLSPGHLLSTLSHPCSYKRFLSGISLRGIKRHTQHTFGSALISKGTHFYAR